MASLVGCSRDSRTLNGMRIETLAVHAGRSIDPSSGAVTPPIHLSTTFERSQNGDYPLGFFPIHARIIPTGECWNSAWPRWREAGKQWSFPPG